MKLKITTAIAATLFSMTGIAQIVTLLSGDFKNLKGISEYNVRFDYDGLTVDRVSEEQFLIDKMKKREGNGKDIEFKKNWFADRENKYEPKFVESFNKRFKKGAVKAAENLAGAKYTMNIKTIWIHPGFNIGIMHNSSLLHTIVSVVETSNPSNVLYSAKYERVSGKGVFTPIGIMDYNSGYRISEGYAKLAKTIAAQINKKTS